MRQTHTICANLLRIETKAVTDAMPGGRANPGSLVDRLLAPVYAGEVSYSFFFSRP
ncbi:MAG: hypothetical protein GY867_00690 [bacterium]|nr:hypothetical protein [bacterium]